MSPHRISHGALKRECRFASGIHTHRRRHVHRNVRNNRPVWKRPFLRGVLYRMHIISDRRVRGASSSVQAAHVMRIYGLWCVCCVAKTRIMCTDLCWFIEFLKHITPQNTVEHTLSIYLMQCYYSQTFRFQNR